MKHNLIDISVITLAMAIFLAAILLFYKTLLFVAVVAAAIGGTVWVMNRV